jgi:hypothetical protein
VNRSGLLRRLPILGVVAVGLWLWQGGAGFVAVPHDLIWKIPGSYGSIRRLEVQLWDGERLLTRTELQTPQGLTMDPQKTLTLPRGTYRSEVLIWREGAQQPEVSRFNVEVGSETTVLIR